MAGERSVLKRVDITGAYPLIFTVLFVVILFQYSFLQLKHSFMT